MLASQQQQLYQQQHQQHQQQQLYANPVQASYSIPPQMLSRNQVGYFDNIF